MIWHHQPDGASDVTHDKTQHSCHVAVTPETADVQGRIYEA